MLVCVDAGVGLVVAISAVFGAAVTEFIVVPTRLFLMWKNMALAHLLSSVFHCRLSSMVATLLLVTEHSFQWMDPILLTPTPLYVYTFQESLVT